jgi:hypothetical protein
VGFFLASLYRSLRPTANFLSFLSPIISGQLSRRPCPEGYKFSLSSHQRGLILYAADNFPMLNP